MIYPIKNKGWWNLKKEVKVKNEFNIKQVKQLSSVLLSLPEVEDLEIDIDNKIINVLFNENFSTIYWSNIILKTVNFEIESIK